MNAASFPWGWLLLLLAWLTTTAILYAGFEADEAAAKDDRKKARNRVRNATRKATRKAERKAARLRPNDSDDDDDSGGATDSSDANTDSSDTDNVDLLRRELEDLASRLPPLRSTIIQLESANSTLESTNSNLQSHNTLLRSANAKLRTASDEAAKERRRADRLEAQLLQQQMFDMQLLAELDREQLRDKSGDDKHFKAKLDLAKASKEAAIQERDDVQQELNRLHGSHQAEIAALTSEKDRLGEDMQSERTIASELRRRASLPLLLISTLPAKKSLPYSALTTRNCSTSKSSGKRPRSALRGSSPMLAKNDFCSKGTSRHFGEMLITSINVSLGSWI